MRSTLLCLLALAIALTGCSSKHGSTVPELPVVPEMEANRRGDDVTVDLSWTFENAANVDEYRVYVGFRIDFGFGQVFDQVDIWQAVDGTSAVYYDPLLGQSNDDICEFGDDIGQDLCVPLYNFTYFRVTAVVDGEEGVASAKVFIGD